MSSFLAMFITSAVQQITLFLIFITSLLKLGKKNVGDFYLCSCACGAFTCCHLAPCSRDTAQSVVKIWAPKNRQLSGCLEKDTMNLENIPRWGKKRTVAASREVNWRTLFLFNLSLINGSNPLIECYIKQAFVSIHSHLQWDCSPGWLNVASQNKNVTFNLKETRHLWPSLCAASLTQLPFSEMRFSSHPFYRFLLKAMTHPHSPLSLSEYAVWEQRVF